MLRESTFWWSIRGKFLIFFIVGLLLTLLSASIINYFTIGSIVSNLNDRVSNSEFNQLTVGLMNLIADIENILDTRIFRHNETFQLAKYDSMDSYSYIMAINKTKEFVKDVIISYPYIDSIYFFIGDNYILETSNTNTQFVSPGSSLWPSDKICDAIKHAGRDFSIIGGLKRSDLPLNYSNTPDDEFMFSILKSYYISGVKLTCGINILENQLNMLYSGLMYQSGNTIRILSADGKIVSSSDKSEIGSFYKYATHLELDSKAQLNQKKLDDLQISWRVINPLGLVVVREMPIASLTSIMQPLQIRMLATLTLGLIVTSCAFLLWQGRILRPLDALIEGMQMTGRGNYEGQIEVSGRDEFSIIAKQFNKMLVELKALENERERASQELRKSEMRALRNQINPHFLYNTLYTIRWMAMLSGARNIAQCITALGKIITPIYKSDSMICYLSDEIELVERYLEIMNFRYSDTLSLVVDIPPDLLNVSVMRFILQPIVENSIQHGFPTKGYRGTIYISARRDGDLLYLFVDDDGSGMDESSIMEKNTQLANSTGNTGVGMMNVSKRLSLHYGPEYKITLEKSPKGGLRTILPIPIERN